MQNITVYKAVLPTKNPEVFTSIMARHKALVEYRLHRQIESVTPLFVFATLKEAQWYAGENYPILEGFTTSLPFNIQEKYGYILNTAHTFSVDMIREFWEQARPGMPMLQTWEDAEDFMWGVYDFTPTKYYKPLTEKEYEAILVLNS